MFTLTRRTRFVCGLAAASFALPTAMARQQLLLNGSFEQATSTEVMACTNSPLDVPDSWSRFGCIEQENAFVFDGSFSVNATMENGAFVGFFQNTKDVEENTRIFMQALVYQPASAPLIGTGRAGIKLEFFQPSTIVVPPPEENLEFDVQNMIYVEDTWVPVSLTTVVPADIDLARVIMISFDESLTNGAVYCDSAFAEVSSAPGVNQLSNESFEVGNSAADGMNPPWDEFADAQSGARKNAFEVPALDGSFVCKMLGRTCGVAQTIPVTPGDTITVSGFFRSRSTAPYADLMARAGVKIEWVAGSVPSPQIDIAPNANPISGTTNIISPTSPTDQWIPVTIDYTMPNNTFALLRATVISGFGPANTDVYFDAFEMVLTNVFDGADSDGDDDEDLLDMANLQRAFTGANGGMVFGGIVFDQTEDDDVDADDSNFALERVTGPAEPME